MSWPGPAQMNIHLRPYKPDPTRWRVDVKLMHPTTHTEIRKRLVAPAGLSEAQARAWGEQQVPKTLGVALGMPSEPSPPPKQIKEAREVRRSLPAPKTISPPKAQMTLERFYYERFEPEHASMQKPATRDGYDTNFRNHLRPPPDKRHLDAYLRAAPGQGAACPPSTSSPAASPASRSSSSRPTLTATIPSARAASGSTSSAAPAPTSAAAATAPRSRSASTSPSSPEYRASAASGSARRAPHRRPSLRAMLRAPR
jgi:hypothetical protein